MKTFFFYFDLYYKCINIAHAQLFVCRNLKTFLLKFEFEWNVNKLVHFFHVALFENYDKGDNVCNRPIFGSTENTTCIVSIGLARQYFLLFPPLKYYFIGVPR